MLTHTNWTIKITIIIYIKINLKCRTFGNIIRISSPVTTLSIPLFQTFQSFYDLILVNDVNFWLDCNKNSLKFYLKMILRREFFSAKNKAAVFLLYIFFLLLWIFALQQQSCCAFFTTIVKSYTKNIVVTFLTWSPSKYEYSKRLPMNSESTRVGFF